MGEQGVCAGCDAFHGRPPLRFFLAIRVSYTYIIKQYFFAMSRIFLPQTPQPAASEKYFMHYEDADACFFSIRRQFKKP